MMARTPRSAFAALGAILSFACLPPGLSGSSGGAASGTTGSEPACVSELGSNQFDPCAGPGSCGCPFQCVYDPLAFFGGSRTFVPSPYVCERGCQTNQDCIGLRTRCAGDVCSVAACGADSGNGTYDSSCSMGDQASDGTCVVLVGVDGGDAAICEQAGASDGGCLDNGALRSQSSDLCLPGDVCAGGQCSQLCDPTTPCPATQSCFMFATNPPSGLCFSQ
jgi:hypothetical protein